MHSGFLFPITDYVYGAEKAKANLDLNPCKTRNMLVTGLEKWTAGWCVVWLRECLLFAFCKHNKTLLISSVYSHGETAVSFGKEYKEKSDLGLGMGAWTAVTEEEDVLFCLLTDPIWPPAHVWLSER